MSIVLNSGFQKGSQVAREKKKGAFDTNEFSLYSPKAFAAIAEVNDTLLSRSIPIQMVRTPEGIKVQKFQSSSVAEESQQIIPNLYHFGLRYGKDLAKNYSSKTPDLCKDFTFRDFDNWKPLFTIAETMDRK